MRPEGRKIAGDKGKKKDNGKDCKINIQILSFYAPQQKIKDGCQGQQVKQCPENDQALIVKHRKYSINRDLEQPVVVGPGSVVCNKGKKAAVSRFMVFKKIPAAVQVIPEVCIGSTRYGPAQKIIGANAKDTGQTECQ